jgi:hypothetical protein
MNACRETISHVGTRVSTSEEDPARDGETAAQRKCYHIRCHLHQRHERIHEIGCIGSFQNEHLTLSKRWCADSESGPRILCEGVHETRVPSYPYVKPPTYPIMELITITLLTTLQ